MATLDLCEGSLLQQAVQEEQGNMSALVTHPSSAEDCSFYSHLHALIPRLQWLC